MSKSVAGFSKLSKRQKIRWLVETFFKDPEAVARELIAWWHPSEEQQSVLDGFTENAISNFPMPYSIAPNFEINGRVYAVPMVIEESSVVAAASSAAKFWMERGGFKTEILGESKLGQLHFRWNGNQYRLDEIKADLEALLLASAKDLTINMEKRGGGITGFQWLDFSELEKDLWQLRVSFNTCDSMGANFINSILEHFGQALELYFEEKKEKFDVIMAILSNYTPNCLVRAWVECPISALDHVCKEMDGATFAERFRTAVRIAQIDPYRATTHNKGIFNGIDAVVLATGNDFRAIEACGHTYASRDGQYRSLSNCIVKNDHFLFELTIPLAIGTVGGLTALHPMAKRSLEMLGNPSASELMSIIAATGLAQNFAALRSLVTTGIQKGHMKMHLTNILNQLEATQAQKRAAEVYFEVETVSFASVRAFLATQ